MDYILYKEMSSYKGRTVKSKSKTRQQKRILEEASKQEGNPLKELLSVKKEEPICRYCGDIAYKSDGEDYICEAMAYRGECKPTKEESVKHKLNII